MVEQFPQWERFPADAQMGALVHLWGLGQNALRSAGDWPLYKAAVLDRDWGTAAEQAIYHPIRECREEDLRHMFNNAMWIEAANWENFCADRQVQPINISRVYCRGSPPRFMSRHGRWRGLEAAGRSPY